jgi:hypothetical protein
MVGCSSCKRNGCLSGGMAVLESERKRIYTPLGAAAGESSLICCSRCQASGVGMALPRLPPCPLCGALVEGASPALRLALAAPLPCLLVAPGAARLLGSVRWRKALQTGLLLPLGALE